MYRFGVPAAFHRTPPISQTDRSWPHDGHFTIQARDSASMLCAHLAGNTATKNFWIVLMARAAACAESGEIQQRTVHRLCCGTTGALKGFLQVPAGGAINHDFEVQDSPSLMATDALVLQDGAGDPVDEFNIDVDFKLYFGVRTVQEINNANKIYTQRGIAGWNFNAAGTIDSSPIDPSYDWHKTGTGVTGDPDFSEVTNGDPVPVTDGDSFNTRLQNQTWSTEDIQD